MYSYDASIATCTFLQLMLISFLIHFLFYDLYTLFRLANFMSFLPKILTSCAGEHYWKHAVPSQSLMHGFVTQCDLDYNLVKVSLIPRPVPFLVARRKAGQGFGIRLGQDGMQLGCAITSTHLWPMKHLYFRPQSNLRAHHI